VSAGGDVTIYALVAASPPTRSGGMVVVESTGGTINTFAPITAQSGDGNAPGDGAGGHVRLTAPGAVAVHASILVNAFSQANDAPGGTVEIEGASVLAAGVTFDADGKVPGPDFPGAPPAGFRFTATAGDVALDGAFHARGGRSGPSSGSGRAPSASACTRTRRRDAGSPGTTSGPCRRA